MFFYEQLLYFGSPSFIMNCYFTEFFIHYFRVYKLIVWDSANIYLFKVNSRNTRKIYEICLKLTKNTIESCSGVFIVNFKHISHFIVCFYCWIWITKCLSESHFLGKYYYSKSRDEQILCLTSFKTATDFLNN